MPDLCEWISNRSNSYTLDYTVAFDQLLQGSSLSYSTCLLNIIMEIPIVMGYALCQTHMHGQTHTMPQHTYSKRCSKSSKHKVPELLCRIVLLPPTPNSDVNVIRSTVIPLLSNRTLEELPQLIINYGSSLVPTVCLSKVTLGLSAVNLEIRVQ